MSRIPLKYHTNIESYTQYTHPKLICSGTDGCTHRQYLLNIQEYALAPRGAYEYFAEYFVD
jgi:hypothetical protein